MSTDQFIFRKSTIKDTGDIFRLYKSLSKSNSGLARDESEITKKYVEEFTLRALKTSTQFVVADVAKENTIVGEIHCYKLEPRVFNHILTDLTIVISPEYQKKGLGKKLFETLLSNISNNRADILRVELTVRESNANALKLYESLGFKAEGRFEKRIRSANNQLEADIPMAWFNPKFRRE
jgi:ribosomal protein S18 acetylase RimI-like enzyme